jgi:hypothetical protein
MAFQAHRTKIKSTLYTPG